MPIIFLVMTAFFKGLFVQLLPYMKCLLYGYNSLNNLAMGGDQSFSINTESCYHMHKLLERIGRAYSSSLMKIISISIAIRLVRKVIDLSIDGLHIPYDGEKRVKDWGTPFNSMMNRAYPGLYPLTAIDLSSNLILYAGSLVRAGVKEWKKRLGNIVAPRVMECIELLKRAGVEVRSVVADEGITSHRLMKNLLTLNKDYTLALKANSRLRRFEPWIKRWNKLDKGRVIGILRNVDYYRMTTNLVIIKAKDRAYLYISSLSKGPKHIWKRFCKRGNHERRHGVASAMGVKSLPSNRLFQVKGHLFTCIYLNLILKKLCKELNLGEIDVETLRSIFTRECYVRWEKDEKKMHATIITSKALLKKLGSKHTISWSNGTIRFIYYREANAPKTTINL